MNTKLNIDSIENGSIVKSKLDESIFSGVYSNMSVGKADIANSLGDRPFVNEDAVVSFRPTAGALNSIKDGIAEIKSIKGNLIVWNQLCTAQHIQGSYDNTSGTDVGYWSTDCLVNYNTSINGHKVYACVIDRKNDVPYYYFTDNVQVNILNGTIFTANTTLLQNAGVTARVPAGVNASWDIDCIFVDLTRMFGVGYEPNTVEELYERLPKGIDLYAYSDGEVVNMNAEGIKSVGFNAWDEEWENGTFDTNTGDNIAISSQIRSKNLIRVVPNSTYEVVLSHSGLWIMLYDSNGNIINPAFLGNIYSLSYNAFNINVDYNPNITSFVTPSNAAYIKFYTEGLYGSTYNNDICIHLIHTGYRNGEYEPYVSDEIALPIADYFPNGMNSIGNVKDELTATEAIQRIGVVDMGTLNYIRQDAVANEFILHTNQLPDIKQHAIAGNAANLLCVKYNTKTTIEYNNAADKNKMMQQYYDIYINDASYPDSNSFKAAMSGVMLYYELAEPIVTKFDTPYHIDYACEDFGTEEILYSNATTPMIADIEYNINEEDTIRTNKILIGRISNALNDKVDKIDIKTLTIGSKSYNTSSDVTIDATDLGLSKVMNYIGKTSTTLSDGSTISSITVDSKTVNVKQGDVVIDSSDSKEYIWNGSKWEEFGNEGNYKIRQNAVTSPNASGNTTSFIDTISQDENGVITATKKNVSFPTYNNATTAAAGLMSAADKSKLDSVPTSFAPTNAEANVQSDWNATSGDAFIKNKPSLSTVATSGSYNDLTDKPTIPSAVTSSTVSDWGFTKNAGTITGIKMNGTSKGSSGVVDLGTVITSHQDISGKADKSSLSTVATSGSYNDLTDKPTIPSAVTSSTVSGWGFTKNAGTITGIKMNGTSKGTSGVVNLGTVITSLDGYATQSWVEGKGYKTTDNDTKNTAGSSNKTGTKLLIVGATSTTTGPTYTNSNCYVGTDNCLYSGGKKVLTSHQDISGKADKSSLSTVATSGSYNDLTNKPTIPSAVTSSTVSGWGFTKNAGTVTGVKINGSTKSPSSGVVDLGTVLTSHQDISGKADKSSLSTVATSGSYNDLKNKPTIPAAYKGNYSTSALSASSTSFTLSPNTYYTIKPSSASTRTFSLGSATSGIVNEYIVEINMSSYAPTIAFPSSVVWANGTAPEYAKGKKYIISIVNNYAVFAEF